MKDETKLKSIERMEEAAMSVLYYAEQWTTANATFFDLQRRRQCLLEAARRYGRAVDNVARKP